MSVHTVPNNDEREHVLANDCWCEPRLLWVDPDTGLPWENGELIVSHNAADCRELVERLTGDSIEPDKNWEVIPV